MKSSKILVFLILIFALPAFISGCGNNKISTSGQQTDTRQDSETAQQSETVQSSIQEATAQAVVVSQVIPAADTKASVKSLIGNWTDINTSEQFANITKTETGYQYEDNDGKYAATFKDGVLKVQVVEGETADAYIDASTGHLFLVYKDNTSEFSKK